MLRGIDGFDVEDIVDILIPSYFYESERELLIKQVESFWDLMRDDSSCWNVII